MIDPPRPPAEWRLVLVADPALAGASAIVETIRSVLESGAVDAIVLRLPGRPLREVLAITSQVRPLATASGAALLSHDRADLALGLGTDGVHLPAAGLPPAFAREILPAGSVIGVSCHSLADVVSADQARADYVFLGPAWATPSKGEPIGLDALRAARRAIGIPLIAIGGVTVENTPEAIAAGATGVAVIRAVWNAPDPRRAARALRDAVQAARATHVV